MTELTQNIMIKDLIVPEQGSELKEASIVILIDSKEGEVFVIGLGEKTKPKAMSYRMLLEELIEGKIKKGTFEKTEYWKKVEESLDDEARAQRDLKFEVIKPLVKNLSLFLRKGSYGKGLVKNCLEFAKENGLKKTTRYQVYQWLYRYLKCRSHKNCFLRKPGTGKGKDKKYSNKTGPKRQEGNVCNGRMREELDEKHIKSIVREFHECDSPIPITDCWTEYRNKYQCDPVYDQFTGEFLKYEERKGELFISKYQFFEYAYSLTSDNRHRVLKAQGLFDEYNKNIKGLSGEIHDIFGDAPGDYQVDETPLAIELVDEFDRNRRLGRPTCYSVIDMFSRAWVGLLLTFAKPSAHTAREIIFISCRNKEVFCKEIGVKLNEPWLPEGKPARIIVDNAEFASALTDAFSADANIEVLFNKEGNSQEKGLVERRHKTLEEFLFGRIPGAISKKYVRSYLARRVRRNAVLNIRELYQILIDFITRFNKFYPLRTLPLSKEMKEDGVKNVPNQKWLWGLVHRAGDLQSVDEDELFMQLLESAQVTVKRDGLFLQGRYIRTFKKRRTSQGLHYTCDWALRNFVYEKEIGKTYDCKFMRYSMSRIWIVTDFGFQEAVLHPNDASFEWWSAECVQDKKIEEAIENEVQMDQYHQEQSKTVANAKAKVNDAKKEQDQITVNAANSQDLSINREVAIDREIAESQNQLNTITNQNYQEEQDIDESSPEQVQIKDNLTNQRASLFAEKARMNRRRRG
jgi:transposase InsO family protein